MNNSAEIADAKAYNMPGVDVDIMASLELIQNLKLTLNYYFAVIGGPITRVQI